MEMELFSSNVKKILIFSQKKAFPIFLHFLPQAQKIPSTRRKIVMLQETETLKNFLYFFQKKSVHIFQETS